MSFRDTIILAMSEEMLLDENVLLMGEDVGIFGGDFGTSVGMLEEFGPERVRDCPISEAAMSGAAAGAAMTGLRPMVDMTFMDDNSLRSWKWCRISCSTLTIFGILVHTHSGFKGCCTWNSCRYERLVEILNPRQQSCYYS